MRCMNCGEEAGERFGKKRRLCKECQERRWAQKNWEILRSRQAQSIWKKKQKVLNLKGVRPEKREPYPIEILSKCPNCGKKGYRIMLGSEECTLCGYIKYADGTSSMRLD